MMLRLLIKSWAMRLSCDASPDWISVWHVNASAVESCRACSPMMSVTREALCLAKTQQLVPMARLSRSMKQRISLPCSPRRAEIRRGRGNRLDQARTCASLWTGFCDEDSMPQADSEPLLLHRRCMEVG